MYQKEKKQQEVFMKIIDCKTKKEKQQIHVTPLLV